MAVNNVVSLAYINGRNDGTDDTEDDTNLYLEKIEEFRNLVGQEREHGLLLLRPQYIQDNWLDLTLSTTTEDFSIQVRFSLGNLYLWGYRRANGDYWVFHDNINRTQGARDLRFTGSYTDSDGFVTISGKRRDELLLGCEQLDDAITKLAKEDRPDLNQALPAKSLLVLVQMFAEAVRLKPIARYIAVHWTNSSALTQALVELENNWHSFSTSMFSSSDWTPETNLPRHGHIWQQILANMPANERQDGSEPVLTHQHMMDIVGVFIDPNTTPPPATIRSRRPRPTKTRTRSLASIEYVRVDGFRHLYGTVKVYDCWSEWQYVYCRSYNNSEYLLEKKDLSLIGPSVVISGEDSLVILVELYEHGFSEAYPMDGIFVWDPRDSRHPYDEVVVAEVSGLPGRVSVGYVVIKEAFSATIRVKINNTAQKLHGSVKVPRSLGQNSFMRNLFDNLAHQSIIVMADNDIPLDRPHFPIPAYSMLHVYVDLWDEDNLIGQDYLQFIPEIGIQTRTIDGLYGQVEVTLICTLFDD